MHNVNLLLQLPLPDLQIDVDKFTESITATIDGKCHSRSDKWLYAPKSVPLVKSVSSDGNSARSAEASPDLFPERAEILDEFFHRLHCKQASVIPEIALKGIREDLSNKMDVCCNLEDQNKG